MPLQNVPTPIADPALPLPSLADRLSYGPRRREWLRWEHEDLTPGMFAFSANAHANASFAAQMADQAASTTNFVGEWGDQTGAATMPTSVIHEELFYVLLQDVADITAHEPGVSIVWAVFNDSSNAEATTYNNATSGLSSTHVQAAIDELVVSIATKIGRTSATGSAIMPVGTTAQRDGTPALGYKRWNTTLNGARGSWETWNGTAWEQEGWVFGDAVATTSGTQIDFNGIPAWINEIQIPTRLLSTNGTSNIIFQLGTSVGFENSGYSSSGEGGVSATNGFVLPVTSAGSEVTGRAVFTRGPGNVWDFSFNGYTVGGAFRSATGHKTMTGQVTRARLTTAGGSNTFDNGSAHIAWRK